MRDPAQVAHICVTQLRVCLPFVKPSLHIGCQFLKIL